MTITEPARFMDLQAPKQTIPQVICGDLRADLKANRKAPVSSIRITEPQEPPLRNTPKSAREARIAHIHRNSLIDSIQFLIKNAPIDQHLTGESLEVWLDRKTVVTVDE